MIVRNDELHKFQIMICDDEVPLLESLERELRKVPGLQEAQIRCYTSGQMLLKALETSLREQTVSQRLVVFSDIEMPDLDGVTMGKRLRELVPDSVLIFTTSHPEYAIHGYEARAFRYLLKPVDAGMLQKVTDEIRAEWNRHPQLLLQVSDTKQLIGLKEILYISAEDKYTIIYTDRDAIMDRTSLQEFEDTLKEYGFCRIHRKYIVNVYHHRKMMKGMLELSNGKQLPVSRRREAEYRELLMKQMEKELI